MRRKANNDGIKLLAVAGTHVVMLGWDMTEAKSRGVLGFAIQRRDYEADELYWLRGMKTFALTDPGVGLDGLVSTREHPLQAFTWSDLTAKPGRKYRYRVVALKGTPDDLQEDAEVSVTITTEEEDLGTHEVWFNRGAAASQEYARRFNNRRPDEVGEPAWNWLSRGLNEALGEFIGRAKNASFALRVAAYQFTYAPVLEALKKAKADGADVRIVYDARKDEVAVPNDAAIQAAGIAVLCTPRKENPSYIAHNKFIVLLRNGVPQAVWTGSTNFTRGGIFGHSDVGHVVNDRTVAQIYLDYWNELAGDPEAKVLRPWVDNNTPTPTSTLVNTGTTILFSPRKGEKLLQWYADLAGSSQTMTCMTFPFGVSAPFADMMRGSFSGLRYALLDSDGGPAQESVVKELRFKPWNRFAVGNFMKVNRFDAWLREQLSGLNQHARYVHTKYMLIDPLGSDPIVVSGSANFSKASTTNNDENMLVVRGDTTVADIYFTEFLRLWKHHAFREWAASPAAQGATAFRHLEDKDTWRKIYYGNTAQSRQRELLAGGS